MKSRVPWTLFVLFIVVGGIAYAKFSKPAPNTVSIANGSYEYRCNNGARFVMTPSEGTNSIHIEPVGVDTFVPSSILLRRPADTGARFEGNGVLFEAQGEVVDITTASSAVECSPSLDSAGTPFNFDD